MVRPEWVLDCIKSNKRLPESEYALEDSGNAACQGLVVETLSVTKTPAMQEEEIVRKLDDDHVLTSVEKKDILSMESPVPCTTVESSVPMDEPEEKTPADTYPLLDRIVFKKSESPITNILSSDKDAIASTPQPAAMPTDHLLSEAGTVKRGGDTETLLRGLVFAINDYSDDLDEDTISKWKDVSFGQYIHVHDGVCSVSQSPCFNFLMSTTQTKTNFACNRHTH